MWNYGNYFGPRYGGWRGRRPRFGWRMRHIWRLGFLWLVWRLISGPRRGRRAHYRDPYRRYGGRDRWL